MGPPQQQPPPDEVELENALRRSARRRMTIVIGVIALVVAYPFFKIFQRWHQVDEANERGEEQLRRERAEREAYANRPLTAPETDRLQHVAPALRDTISKFEAEWRGATSRDSLARVVALSAPCPVHVSSPTFEAGDSYVRSGGRVALEFSRVQLGGAPLAPDFAAMIATGDAIAKHVASGVLSRKDLEAAEQLYAPSDTVKFLVTIEDKPAIAHDDGTYVSGLVVGTAYIYDLKLGAILCAGRIQVENSPGIQFNVRSNSALPAGGLPGDDSIESEQRALERDLAVRVQRAIAAAVRATTAARDP